MRVEVCDIDLKRCILHLAFNYLVKKGQRVRKDTKTHQDRYLAIDPVTCAMISEHLEVTRANLADFGLALPADAYVFSNDPKGVTPWNPDWATHKAGELAVAAGVKLNIKGLRHYTASLPTARGSVRFAQYRGTWAIAVAGLPPSGTTPILYRRLTGEPPPTSHN
jgi:hypothetical protein